MRIKLAVALLASLTIFAAPALAQVTFAYDFEQGEDLAAYQGLELRSVEAAIVAPGAGGEGHCLRISNTQTGKYCTLTVRRPMPVVRNLVLSFDYRAVIGEGQRANYVGILFFYADDKQFGRFDHKFSDDWAHAEVPIGTLMSPNEGVLEVGREFSRLNVYGRATDEGGDMIVWLDNIRLEVRESVGRLLERVEVSYSNPPLLNWPRTVGISRLQYSRSPDFPGADTVTVDCDWNFHTPPQPIEPGRWYWRTRMETELTEGWTDTHRLEIPVEAHRFTTEPIDAEAILARPRPWLVDVAAERAKLDEAGLAALVRRVESDYKQGVPDDPPIWVEGDERWPAWIDWYRDVHGRITSATGRRVERSAQWAAISGDDQAHEWVREMALALAAWDPQGGSAMNRGDIGAHHVLLGLSAAYDVLRDRLTEPERETLRDAIAARLEDFWKYINPLRGNPYNNHAWLKTLAVGQAGLALLGDHEDAYQWAEFSRQQFIGQYLCGLGWQGDNNEGLSYWSYGLSFIIGYSDLLRTATGIDLYQQPWLNQTARFVLYCAPPNAWGVSFADTGRPNHGVRGPYSTTWVGLLGERTRDPYALWYAGHRTPVEDIAPRPPVDLPQSILYRFIGLGVVNGSLVDGREGVTFAMHSGPYYAGHQHADQNAFVIHAWGEKLAIDSGYYDWYGSPHFKQYSLQTVAHNTVLVNGEGQAAVTTGADGHMTAWFDSPGYAYLVGDASDPEVYRGLLTRFDRRVLMVKPGVIVIQDLLDAPEPSSFDWLLHTVAPIEVDEAAGSFAVTSGAARMTARMLAPERISTEVTDRYPVHPYDGYGTVPVSEEKLAQEWHLTVRPTEPAARQDFLTVFDVRRAEDRGETTARPMAAQVGVGLILDDGAQRTAVLLPDRDGARPLAAGDLCADAEAAAVTVQDGRVVGAFAYGCGSLERAGQVLLACDERATGMALMETPEGMVVTVSLERPAEVMLFAPASPQRTAATGSPTPVEWDAATRTLRLRLDAGEHTIAYGDRPEQALSHPLAPLTISVGGERGELAGYARRTAEGLLCNWWGQVTLPAADRYTLRLEGLTDRPPLVSWDGTEVALEVAEGAASASIMTEAGAHNLTISAAGGLGGVSLRPSGLQRAAATMLPKDWSLPGGAVVVEAEKPSAEGEVRGKIVEKVGASGGLANGTWDTDGMWAEWQLTVPAAGRYRLVIRGATEYDDVVREVLLDGRPLPGAPLQEFSSTGGWCRTTDDWRYFVAADEAGEALLLELAAGEHTLRLTRLTGSMNLDLVALVGE